MTVDELSAAFAALGPWGVLVGVLLTLAAQWAKRRVTPAPMPVAEVIDETPPRGRLFDGSVLRFLIEYGPEIRRLVIEYGPAIVEILKALEVIKPKVQSRRVEPIHPEDPFSERD